MATHCGLGQGIRVLKGDVSRSTLAGWRKEALVDALMSLALSSGAIPGVREHLEVAHRVSIKSPANGGGMEAARAYLKDVVLQPNPELFSTDDDSGAVDNGTNSDDGPSDASVTDHQPPSVAASQSTMVGENSGRGPGLCRSNWRGTRCSEDTCGKVHREYCLRPSCYPARDAACSQWHPRSWIAPNMQGNGQKGSGQPTKKVAKSKSRPKDSILSREIKLLRQEVALYKERSRLEARKHSMTPRAATYRDAVVASLPPVQHRQPPQLATQSVQPLAPLVPPELHPPSANSATALPADVMAAIQFAVKEALNNLKRN